MHDPSLTLTMQRMKARKLAAQEFGKKPAPQGANGPGIKGESGGATPSLGRRFVNNGFRTQGK